MREQVERIWQTEQGRYGMENFLYQWLELDGAGKGRKFDLRASQPYEPNHKLNGKNTKELTLLVKHFFETEQSPTLKTLLTFDRTVMHDDLAVLYGMEPMGSEDFYVAGLDPAKRPGILTRASWMYSHSQSRVVSPTFRGLFIMNRLLCNTLPPPPDTLNTNVPRTGSLSPREDFESNVTTNKDCAGCHLQFDYFGYALDNYDYYGRWRTNYIDFNEKHPRHRDYKLADFPVDPQVTVKVDGEDHEIAQPADLMSVLGDSPQVRQCAVHHWYAYAIGRTPEVDWADKKGGDYCAVSKLRAAFEQSGGDLRELVVATVLSDAFLYLSPELDTKEN